jgi:predicted nucleotidyltransferase
MNIEELCNKNKIVKMYAGSIAYGTQLPTSDVDFRGLFCCDPINIQTPFYPIKEYEDKTEEDTKYYELSHFMKLCLACNPNIIELLWTDDSDITFRTPAYDMLRANRHKLLSRKIAHTTTGFALAQLKRISNHNKWINKPQSVDKPKQKDFVSMVQWFGVSKLMPRDFSLSDYHTGYRMVPFGNNIFGLYESTQHTAYHGDGSLDTQLDTLRSALTQSNSIGSDVKPIDSAGVRIQSKVPLAVVIFNKEEWKIACDTHTNYWTWKNNRNQARSELEHEFGYDTKNAMHLVRLLRMGVEALRDGEIVVKRPDAQELLDIRAGAWTYEEVVAYAEKMENEVQSVWYPKTALRKKPDIKLAANILMTAQQLTWKNI